MTGDDSRDDYSPDDKTLDVVLYEELRDLIDLAKSHGLTGSDITDILMRLINEEADLTRSTFKVLDK